MKRYQLRIDWELYQYDKLGEFNSLDEAAAWIESLSDAEVEKYVGGDFVLTDSQTNNQWIYTSAWEQIYDTA